MSFAGPLVLLGLLVLPALAAWYISEQRRRSRAAAAFVSLPLSASVAPRRPGFRRGVPPLLLGLALVLLVLGAARPQVRVTVPVTAASVILANDTSASMAAKDVTPSRLVAAQKAAVTFTETVPASVGVGAIEFAGQPMLLQSPTTDHALVRAAIDQPVTAGGHTAIGAAIETGLSAIKDAPKVDGKHPPGAIVLLSDGTSDAGVSLSTAIAAAKAQHVKIYTIAIGTASGTIQVADGKHKSVTTPVPVDPTELRQIASGSGGTFASAPSRARAQTVYAHLAKQLGHTRVLRDLIAWFAVAGLLCLLAGAGLSLFWFGALA